MVFFLISLVSCSSSKQLWKFRTIKATYPCSTYTKIYLPTCHPFNGLEAELLCNGPDMALFLNALILCFPNNTDIQGKIVVDVCIDEQYYQFLADRFEGGQRLKLPNEAMQLIIASLLDNSPVKVSVDRYEAILETGNFKEVYLKVL